MKEFTNFAELINAPLDVRNYLAPIIKREKGPFDEIVGGNIFLVETLEDLKEIPVYSVDRADALEAWPTVFEYEGEIGFELAQYTHNRDHLFVYHAVNDSGGPSWFIPRSIYLQRPNLMKEVDSD
jgi:hypothetical protein